MSEIAVNIANMVNMLPENDQKFAYEFVKKLILAWDPDYTKLTPEEERQLKQTLQENEYHSIDEINWD